MKLVFADQREPWLGPLPEFSKPPVVETSIGIQFDGLVGYSSLSAASFRARIKDSFPFLEEQPPLDPAFETFGPRSALPKSPQFQVVEGPVFPRFFFMNKSGTELVQLQRDRLFLNWRKRGQSDSYPRYTYLRAELERLFSILEDWASEEGIGRPRPTQVEAIYVNAIPLKDIDGKACGLSYIFPWLEGLRGVTEDGSFQFRRRLIGENGQPQARLNFSLQYGTEPEGERAAQLMLHVRGLPPSEDLMGFLPMIDAEREIIVRTFTDVTSDDSHQMWGRTR